MKRYVAVDEDDILQMSPVPFTLVDKWVRVSLLDEKVTKYLNEEAMVADIHRETRHVHLEDEPDAYIVNAISGNPDVFFVAYTGHRVGVYHKKELTLLMPLPIECLMRALELLYRYGQKEDDRDFSVEHDEILVSGKHPDNLTPQVVAELRWLGWTWDEEYECWQSFV